jgi:hypothetical protein
MTELTPTERLDIEKRAALLFPADEEWPYRHERKAYISGATYERQRTKRSLHGIKTQVGASRLIMGPKDDYKKGWNEALTKVLNLIEDYQDGKGLFQ